MSAAASSTTASTSGLFARGPRAMTIGLLESAFDLPHPRVNERLVLVIHQALVAAFVKLRQEHGSLANDLEDVVTVPLHNILENDLRYRRQRKQPDAIPGFDDTLIESIVRHSGTTDHTGTHLKKEPDLFIKLRPPENGRVLATDYAIFVECKPVDKKHPTWGDYCEKGLMRFVDGTYAWAMQESLMIGYTRHGRSLSKHLPSAISRGKRAAKLGIDPTRKPALNPISGPTFTLTDPLHVSEHKRSFAWRWNKGSACAIRVYHSWHDCS